jgi:leader peptidase (prepilin peptidase) / N-methyltransferase
VFTVFRVFGCAHANSYNVVFQLTYKLGREEHVDPRVIRAIQPVIELFVFLFGLLFGSFLNVCIYRLPREKSIVWPGSACPACGHPVRWYDNIPVLSWMLLGGRCRDCKARISPRYLLIEITNALLFLACYAEFGYSLATVKFCIFSFLLLGLICTDAETRLLPDSMTLGGLAIGLVFSLLVPVRDIVMALGPYLLKVPHPSWRLFSLGDAALGALVGAGFIYGVGAAYLIVRRVEGMGFGDVKLMAMVGAFLGMKLTLLTIFGGSLLGAVYGLSMIPVVWMKRTRRRMAKHKESTEVARQRAWESAKKVYRFYAMPFGVFLGSVAIFWVFFGQAVFRWYWHRFLW